MPVALSHADHSESKRLRKRLLLGDNPNKEVMAGAGCGVDEGAVRGAGGQAHRLQRRARGGAAGRAVAAALASAERPEEMPAACNGRSAV